MPASPEVLDGNAISFHCTAQGCTYSKRDACGIVLHMRTHFIYETAEKDMPKATFFLKDGLYQCLDCDRKTNSRISFREHVRHHILPLPYRCHCGTAVASIPALRKHSSVAHPKTPLQMCFEDTDGMLGEILCSVGREKQTFWFPKRVRLVDSAKVVNLSDISEPIVSGGVVNDCPAKTNSTTEGEGTDLASRLLVRRANVEPRQSENCSVLPSGNGSGLRKGPSSTSASVLEFSAEYNYINAFSCSKDTTESDSNAFLVLNLHDKNSDKTSSDSLEDFFQANTESPEISPRNGQRLPLSGSMVNLRSFDNSVLAPHSTDLSCITRDITLSYAPLPLNNEEDRQLNGESDSEQLTVYSRATTSDSEVVPISPGETMETALESVPSGEPMSIISGPGKFVFCDDKFKCLTCLNWETVSEYLFRKHAWQHLHGVSGICKKSECQSEDCPLVLGLVMLVMNVGVSRSTITSEPGSNTLRKIYPCATLTSQCSDVGKASNTSCSKISDLENFCDIEPCSPAGDNFASQKENSAVKTEEEKTERNVIDNLSQISAEQLRVSAPTLFSLRSKACRHLTFNSDLASNYQGNDEKLQKDDINHIEVTCVRNTELNGNEPIATEKDSASVSEEDTISPHRRKQRLMIKQDINLPVEYCRYSRDLIPLSTACGQCSYTCNCNVQLTWHVESCHPKSGTKKRKDFCCTECGFSDVSKQTLIWHMAHHIGQHNLKVFGCKYCDRQSTYMSRIMKHIYRVHSGKVMKVTHESTNVAYMDGIFKCPFCHSGYPWGSLFFRHIESQHKLKQLADYLAHANHKKCCPEVIEFPKCLVLNILDNEIPKDNQSLMAINDSDQSATPGCLENENISKIQQHSENSTGSIKSEHSKDLIETDDRRNIEHISEPHTPLNSVLEVKRNVDFCSSAKNDVHNTNETRGSFCKPSSKGAVKSVVNAKTSGKCSKNLDLRKGSISYWKLRPCMEKTAQNDVIVYNSAKRRNITYQSPKTNKRSFLISPSRVPTLPRNLGNATVSDFEKSLPDQFIFSQAIKCPKCYYTDRIRLNLIRHYNGHLTNSSKGGEMSEPSDLQRNAGDGLTFTLWKPKMSDKEVTNSDKVVANKKKDLAFVSKGKRKEPSQKRRSTKHVPTVKRAKLTDEAHELDSGDKKESCDTGETTKCSNIGNLTSGQCLTAGNDIQKTSTSFGSAPAFGQFLQNHAKKVMATFNCDSCSTTFNSETEYNKHAEDVHSSTYYLCRCCGIMIRGLPNVQVHFKEKHPGSPVLVDEWVSANKESRKRIRPFSEVSDVGLPVKKAKKANLDGDKADSEIKENRQSPDKTDSEIKSLPKEQKWSSFYGAKLRTHPTSGTDPNPTVRATSSEFSTLNTFSQASSDICSQTTSSTMVSTTHTSTAGNTVNAVGASASQTTTGMASHTVAANTFPPPLGSSNLLAAFFSNLLAANLMTSQTTVGTQVPAMQAIGTQIPLTVAPATPVMMAGHLPVLGTQSVVDNSSFSNLLASLLMANLTAGTGQAVPTTYPNEIAAVHRDTAFPFQLGAYNSNLLGTANNPQHLPSVAEMIKEAFNPSNVGDIYNISTSASAVNVQNSISAAEVSKYLPNLRCAATLVPDASDVATHDSCDDNSRQSFCSLDSASKPVCTATGSSKPRCFSGHESLYSSEAESTISIASQRSSNSKSSRSTSTSKKSSKRHPGAQKLKKNQSLRDDCENYALYTERCSSRSSVSTIDISHTKSLSNNSSPLPVADIFAARSVQMCCNRCEYKTKKLKHFEKHLAVHFENKQPSVDPKLWKPVRQKCGFCNFQTYLDEEFEEHIAIHTIKKPFQCSYCSFSGFTKVSVNRHLIRLHPELEPKVEKNKNVRVKQTVPRISATKFSLNPFVKLKNVLKLNQKAVKSLY